jgi:hypothetical protein
LLILREVKQEVKIERRTTEIISFKYPLSNLREISVSSKGIPRKRPIKTAFLTLGRGSVAVLCSREIDVNL